MKFNSNIEDASFTEIDILTFLVDLYAYQEGLNVEEIIIGE